MPQFSIRHLLVVTAYAAMAFALSRFVTNDTTNILLVWFTITAPVVCYGIGEMVGTSSRSRRRWVRKTLLVIVLLAILATSLWHTGSLNAFGPAFVILFWGPQLVLLKYCSFYRSAIEANRV